MQDFVKVTNDTNLLCPDKYMAEEQGGKDGSVVLEGDAV
jgi:hypothetical protein